jgi:hypothetical protein
MGGIAASPSAVALGTLTRGVVATARAPSRRRYPRIGSLRGCPAPTPPLAWAVPLACTLGSTTGAHTAPVVPRYPPLGAGHGRPRGQLGRNTHLTNPACPPPQPAVAPRRTEPLRAVLGNVTARDSVRRHFLALTARATLPTTNIYITGT